MVKRLSFVLAFVVLLAACGTVDVTPTAVSSPTAAPTNTAVPTPVPTSTPLPANTPTPGPATRYTYRIINSYPHDPAAFTEGLVWDNGTVYESTGLSRDYGGISTLRRVDLESGDVLQSINLPDQYFGEGLVVWGNTLIQLTWRSNVGFVYDKTSFELLREFNYPTEGWGFTQDGERLIMSDGTATLHFLDPETLVENGRVEVHDENGPILRLNELEYVNGEVWANVWQTDQIVRIDPADGRVIGRVDLTGLLSPAQRQNHVDVLNGIMYDAANSRLFVTGKYWPLLFEIEVEPLP